MTLATTCTRDQAEQITTRFRESVQRVESAWNVMVATAIDAFQNRVWEPLGYRTWDDYCASEVDTAAIRIPRELRIQIVGQMSEAHMSTRAIGAALGVDQKTVVNDRRAGEENSSPAFEQIVDPVTGASVVEIEYADEGPFGFVPQAPPPTTPQGEPDDEPLTEAECEALDDVEYCDCGEGLCECLAGECSCGQVPALPESDRVAEPEVQPARITGTDGKSYPAPTEQKKPNRRPITDSFRDAAYDLGKKVATLANLVGDDRFKKNADQLAERNLSELTRARDALQRVIDQLTV